MNTFFRSEEFDTWLADLKDKIGRARIIQRIHVGPGYRVYYLKRQTTIYLLLLGGAKSSQKRDIKRALGMAYALKQEKLS